MSTPSAASAAGAPDSRRVRRLGPYVWKAGGSRSAFEREFLRRAPHDRLQSLALPRLRAVYADGYLIDYHEREHHTRDTIVDRAWGDEDVRRFVGGLREFQSIRVPRRAFSWRRRVLGWAYPAYRLFRLDRRTALLCLRYVLARPCWRNVLTHYDLHTYNYAFAADGRMSMIDFERMYASGDPLYDLLYFCTIPPVRLEDWTFQRRLLRALLRRRTPFARLRTRVILLQCNLGRLRASHTPSAPYRDNVELLRDGRRYRSWWRAVTAS